MLIQRWVHFDFLQKGSGTSFPITFLYMIFPEKYFSCGVLLTDQISLSGAFIFWDIGQYIYWNYLFSARDVVKFEINFSFLIKPFSYMTELQASNLIKKRLQQMCFSVNIVKFLRATMRKAASSSCPSRTLHGRL